jgi:beta-glucanase (GH16 family)
MTSLWRAKGAKHRARPARRLKGHALSAPVRRAFATKRARKISFSVISVALASAVAAAPASASSPANPTAGMHLAFSATFPGTQLNTGVFETCYPWFPQNAGGCTNFGNAQEREWYLPSQVQVSNGAMHLVATETPTTGWNSSGQQETYQYASGMVTTFSSFNFTYGYIQIVARVPGGTGTWPALWLLPENETWPPEIDIMENYGSLHVVKDTIHWESASGAVYQTFSVTTPNNLTVGWHTYALLWTPGSLTWYLDGSAVASYTGSNVPSQPMYFLANLAIDGAAPQTSSFDIQSVQVWEP